MKGHGHVNPNPEGVVSRCGGPNFCNTCKLELVRERDKALAATEVFEHEPRTVTVTGSFQVCEPCLAGRGGECHTAGCAFWLMSAPDLSFRDNLLMYGCEVDGFRVTAEEYAESW